MRNNIHFICLKIHCKWCGKVVSKDSETLDIPQDSVVSNIYCSTTQKVRYSLVGKKRINALKLYNMHLFNLSENCGKNTNLAYRLD